MYILTAEILMFLKLWLTAVLADLLPKKNTLPLLFQKTLNGNNAKKKFVLVSPVAAYCAQITNINFNFVNAL